jgi:8-oxo-dGTP diphosphatase
VGEEGALNTVQGSNPSGVHGEESFAVDVRVALFTVAEGELLLALTGGDHAAALPRQTLRPGASLDNVALGVVRTAIGSGPDYIEQLYTLEHTIDGDHDAVSVSYLALIGTHGAASPSVSVSWASPSGPLGAGLDHKVVDYALVRLRAKLGYTNIAFNLLPESFTLTQLQTTYEVILGRRLDKRNFRRRITASGILQPTATHLREGSHRPAALYRFSRDHDPSSYLTPPWAWGAER